MTTGNVHADPTVLVEHLTACIDRFAAAWQARLDAPPVVPPDLAEFLPTETALFRRMALVELVKVDLDRRWRHTNRRMALEGYAAKFPELLDDGRMPGDLIYEEFRLRAVHGDRVEPEEYFARFPDQQDEIRALLANMNTEHTTSLSAVSRAVEYKAGDVIDDFLLIAQLGRGAFGSVFQARQQSLGRMVALKITADTGFESHTLAQLDHPNIVRVFDQRQLPPQLRLMYM